MVFTGITVLCQINSNLSANASTRPHNESHLLSRGSHSIFLVQSNYSDVNLEGRLLRWACCRASSSCFMCNAGGKMTISSRPQRKFSDQVGRSSLGPRPPLIMSRLRSLNKVTQSAQNRYIFLLLSFIELFRADCDNRVKQVPHITVY